MRRQFVPAACEVGASDLRRVRPSPRQGHGGVSAEDRWYAVDFRGPDGRSIPGGRCLVSARHGDPIVSAARVAARRPPGERRRRKKRAMQAVHARLDMQGLGHTGSESGGGCASCNGDNPPQRPVTLTQDTRFCIPLGLLFLPVLAVGGWLLARGR